MDVGTCTVGVWQGTRYVFVPMRVPEVSDER